MKRALLYPTLFILLLFLQCNPENEEDLYYEPLVDGIYNIEVDLNESLEFTIESNKATSVSGQFSNGIPFTVEFEANVMRFNEKLAASIMPVSDILDMPTEFQFNFGFVFSPEGTYFTKPGKMTIELPPDLDISEFKGFFFQGGVPWGDEDPEIWSVKLTPLLFQTEGGKKLAVFEIPHFSGFVGVSGGDFECGNPRAAETCEELKEILACYIAGKESLSGDDIKKVNKALEEWMDAGLDWLEIHPEELEDLFLVEEAIRELVCWKASVLMFNSDMTPFQKQLDRIGDLFTGVLIDRLVSANEECLSLSNIHEKGYSYEGISFFMSLVDELRNGGFLNEDPDITLLNYCDEIATKPYLYPFLDTSLTDYIKYYAGNWFISLGEGEDNVAYSRSFQVYANNLLGEQVELSLGEDYIIQNYSGHNHTLEGTTITEVLGICYGSDANGNSCCPYPCWAGGHSYFEVVLTSSGEKLNVEAFRFSL